MLIETLQATGLTLLVFRVIPNLPTAAHGAALLMGTALVPAILNLVASTTNAKPKSYNARIIVLLDIFAVLAQLSAIVLWPVLTLLKSDNDLVNTSGMV